MPVGLLAWYLKLPVFALVASRLGGLVMFQPVIGGYAIPARVRALFVLGLAALVTPFVSAGPELPDRPTGLILASAEELLLGVLLGLVVRMCFLGLQLGGQLIAQESGLAFGRVADPSTGEDETLLSNLYLQLGAVVFLIIGGHRALLAVALDTFARIPLLSVGTGPGGHVELLFDALTLGGQIALRTAAPVVLTLFLVNAAMGFVSRTVPQLNILTVGFSIKGLVAFVLVAVSLPAAFDAFTGALETVVGWIGAW